MQINQKKGSLNMNPQKTHGDAVSLFSKFQVKLTILFKQYSVLLSYKKIKIEKN